MGRIEFFGRERVLTLLFVFVIFAGAACGLHASSQKMQGAAVSKNERAGPVVYAALGDSTGVGVGARNGGYVARLFTRIEQVRPGSRLINLCVSGATTDDVLRGQVAPAAAALPTLVTLGIGINDIGHGVSVQRFAGNYEEIVSRIREKTGAPIVITNIPDISLAPIVPAYMRAEAHSRVVLFNDRINDIAKRHGLLAVDAYTATRDLIPSNPAFFSPDNFHPSDLGYERWAETMWPTVKSAIGE